MKFILDTNAYRNLASKVDSSHINGIAVKLRLAEQRKKSSTVMSIVVAMELIQHLIIGDPAQKDCYDSLRLLSNHTRYYNIDTEIVGGDFYPPMNIILAQHYFNENSKYLELYDAVINLINSLVKVNNIDVCKEYQAQIETVKKQLEFEQNGVREGMENLLKELNGGVLDWAYYKHHDEERETFFKDFHNGKISHLAAIGLMQRAHQVMEQHELVNNAEEKLLKFMEQYEAALNMNLNLMQLLGNGVEKIQNPADPRWNTIHDMDILFAVLYKRSGDEDKVLVTDDKKVKAACFEAGAGERIMMLKEYLNYLEINVTMF